MTAEAGFGAHLSRAEGRVRNARQCWDPSSLSGCEKCAEQLQHAVDEMTAAYQSAAAGWADKAARARLERLRGEAEVLSRLVDSAMAFSRGLALRTASEEQAVRSELKG